MKNNKEVSEKIMKNQVCVKKGKGKGRGQGRTRSSSEKNAIKVVYISTPMKVKTSASKFMNIVQKLTGRESDVVRIMESCEEKDNWMVLDHDHDHDHHHHGMVSSSLVVDDGSSPSSSSEELVDHHHHHHHHHHFDLGVLGRGQEESGPFDCNLFFDHHEFSFHFGNELGNY